MTADPRGTSTGRGYDYTHQQMRARLIASATPDTPCARCGRPLGDVHAAHLGHTDDRAGWTGLEHAGQCNVTAANTARAARRRRSRESHPGLLSRP